MNPEGDGSGGTSICGTEFEDEFYDQLLHTDPLESQFGTLEKTQMARSFTSQQCLAPGWIKTHCIWTKIKGKDVITDIESVSM
jgi:peptidylprolyl isomerase domain and WD repeat-containing protein 1